MKYNIFYFVSSFRRNIAASFIKYIIIIIEYNLSQQLHMVF